MSRLPGCRSGERPFLVKQLSPSGPLHDSIHLFPHLYPRMSPKRLDRKASATFSSTTWANSVRMILMMSLVLHAGWSRVHLFTSSLTASGIIPFNMACKWLSGRFAP